MTPPPNTDVTLHEGWIRLRTGADVTTARGSIYLSWQPVPRIRFRVRVPTVLTDERVDVEFAVRRRRARGSAFVTSTQVSTRRGYLETDLEGFFQSKVDVGDGRGLSAITFELPNFPEIEQLLRTTAGPWTIALARSASREAFQSLRKEGGYGLTGTGRIERSDGRGFSARAAEPLIDALLHFLSFAAGMWTQPMLLTGLDGNGDAIWHSWAVWRTSRWEFRPHWLPRRGQQAAWDLFGAWHGKWRDPYWREVLERTTYFFVDANRSIVDIGLLTSQSALETLAYAISVVERKSITAAAFNARTYRAADKIRGLLADTRIPAAVPPALGALDALAHPAATADGPAKITWLRNRLVHPLRAARTPADSSETYEAWRLALWYVEATLLSSLGYRGALWSRVSLSDQAFP